jgi:sugar/nucleoside kinase (ribokinase family)
MKIAVVGPVVKDKITVDGKTKIQIGGIAYYQARAFHQLGAQVSAFLTFGTQDKKWVEKKFEGIPIVHIPVQETQSFERTYAPRNPDVCLSVKISYAKNRFPVTKPLITKLKKFDWVLFGPLFEDNIPVALFERLRGKKLALGNFGIFSRAHRNELVYTNPNKVFKVSPLLSYFFIDKAEAQFLSGKKDVRSAGKFLIKKGLARLVITEGSKGSTLFEKNKMYKIPAYKPKRVADPTGAGDTYGAAFIRATKLFSNPVQQGKFAAMTASMKLENRGAFRGSLQKVLKRLQSE